MEEKDLNKELAEAIVASEIIEEEKLEEEKEEQEEILEEKAEEQNELEQVEEEEEYTGPVIQTQVKYDYRTMKYFNMYNMIHKRHFNIIYIVMGLVSIAFAGYQVYSGLTSEEGLQGIGLILPIVFVLFGVYFIYQSICFEKVIDKNISMHFMRQPKVFKMTLEVTERKITMLIPGREGEPISYPWEYVTEIVEIPEYFFLYVQKQPIIIEKDPNMVVSGDYETLVNIIMEKTSTKPYKKTEKQIVKNPITFVHPEENDYDVVENEEVVEEEQNNNE